MISSRFKIIALACLLSLLMMSWPAGSRAALGRSTLINGSFTVEPGKMRYWTFRVGRGGARVNGRFRAQGGSGNDIEVYILDPDGFENYRNGHQAPTYYNSRRVTVGTINVELNQGDYYLIFNNSFSAVSNKAVAATVTISD